MKMVRRLHLVPLTKIDYTLTDTLNFPKFLKISHIHLLSYERLIESENEKMKD